MNIYYIGPFRFPCGDAAGARVLNNAKILMELGHKVKVISFGGEYLNIHEPDHCVDNIEYLITNDIDTHSWKERILRYVLPAPNARKILEKEINKADIIIGYNTVYLNNYLIRLCRRKSKKFILDITEWPVSNEYFGGKLSPFFWMSEYNMRIIQKKIKNIISISTFLYDYYRDNNGIEIPPLVNLADEKWNARTESMAIPKFSGKRIIFAGTPAKKGLLGNIIQGIHNRIKAGANLQLIVLGVTLNQVKGIVPKDMELDGGNFRFLGRIPQKDVPSYYHLSDFSAIIRVPNRKNMAGFPTKMAESMASGIPVLFNPTSNLEKIARDGINAISIDGYSVENVEEGLKRIEELSEEQLTQMKKNAVETAKKIFDYRNYVNPMSCFLNNLR